MTTKEFAEKHGLELNLISVPRNPSMEDSQEKMINYLATISKDKKLFFEVYFSTGLGWVCKRSTGTRVQNVTWSPKYNDFIVNEKGRNYMSQNYDRDLKWTYKILRPSISDVLECVKMDFQSVESEGFVFENWAENLGYSADSIKAKKTFDLICEQRMEFLKAFGIAIYNELLTTEEE